MQHYYRFSLNIMNIFSDILISNIQLSFLVQFIFLNSYSPEKNFQTGYVVTFCHQNLKVVSWSLLIFKNLLYICLWISAICGLLQQNVKVLKKIFLNLERDLNYEIMDMKIDDFLKVIHFLLSYFNIWIHTDFFKFYQSAINLCSIF